MLLVNVVLRNITDEPVKFNLRDFFMTDRNGKTYGPVNIRSVKGVAAANYIPEDGNLPPGAKVAGYLTFDARTGGAPPVPSRVGYIDGKQSLVVVFKGKHSSI